MPQWPTAHPALEGRGTPALRATLSDVQTVAGWAATADGQPLAFAWSDRDRGGFRCRVETVESAGGSAARRDGAHRRSVLRGWPVLRVPARTWRACGWRGAWASRLSICSGCSRASDQDGAPRAHRWRSGRPHRAQRRDADRSRQRAGLRRARHHPARTLDGSGAPSRLRRRPRPGDPERHRALDRAQACPDHQRAERRRAPEDVRRPAGLPRVEPFGACRRAAPVLPDPKRAGGDSRSAPGFVRRARSERDARERRRLQQASDGVGIGARQAARRQLDLHILAQLGTTYSMVDASAPTPDAICDAIKRGRVEVVSTHLNWFRAGWLFARMVFNGRGKGDGG